MKRNPQLLLATILLATSFAAPASAQFNETGIGGALRRIPFFRMVERSTENPMGVEADVYELPEPLNADLDEEVPAMENTWYQQDPIGSYIWAHTVDLDTVTPKYLEQFGQDVRRIVALRRLRREGGLPKDATTDLDGLSDHGRHLLTHYQRSEVQSLLATIRFAEGTYSERGYWVAFGHARLHNLNWHTMRVRNGSSAEGAYQFMNYTWPGTARALGLRDFTPLSQDLAALLRVENRLRDRGMSLDDVKDENFERVIHALAPEWASFPCGTHASCPFGPGMSRYSFRGRPQPTKRMSSLWETYKNARDGRMPPIGATLYNWDAGATNALMGFQYAYEVDASGNFNSETWAALFGGRFGSAGGQESPFASVSKPLGQLPVARGSDLYRHVEGQDYYLKASLATDGDWYPSGLRRIYVQVIRSSDGSVVDAVESFSGVRGQQDFGSVQTLRRGTAAPTPQGVYTINHEMLKAEGRVPGKVRGIDWAWLYMRPVTHVGTRAALGLHGNGTGSNATLGCIAQWSKRDAHAIYDWVQQYGITHFVVDWGV